MENYFGLLRYAFLVLMSLFLFEVIRTLTRNLEENGSEKQQKKPVFLYVINGADYLGVEEGHIYKFTRQCSMGRNRNNNIVIEDPCSSNFHAVVMRKKGNYYLSDMESKNGTYHNDTKVTREVLLEKDDKIRIGNVEFKFQK